MKMMKTTMMSNINLDLISKSDYLISLGAMLSKERSDVVELLSKKIENEDFSFVYMHPVEDNKIKSFCTQYLKYEVGSEEGVIALLIYFFVKDASENIQEFIDDLDIGYISAESSAGEEEFEDMVEMASNKSKKILLLGDDLFTHERVENISSMLKILKEYTDFEILFTNEENAKYLVEKELAEVEELNSFNGTVVYSIGSESLCSSELVGSTSFSRVAKISDGDDINIILGANSVNKKFKLDTELQGTIALTLSDDSFLSNGYRFKQVKIEKVGA